MSWPGLAVHIVVNRAVGWYCPHHITYEEDSVVASLPQRVLVRWRLWKAGKLGVWQPQGEARRYAYAVQVGTDGLQLLGAFIMQRLPTAT